MRSPTARPREARALAAFWKRHRSMVLLVFVAATLLGTGARVVRDLRQANDDAREMYAGLALGLDVISDLEYQSQEARRSILYALTTTDANLQVIYADQAREADRRVSELVGAQLRLQSSSSGLESGRRFEADWAAYGSVRDEVAALILEGSVRDAVELDLRHGIPAFQRARDDLLEMKRLYKEQAGRQLAAVEASSKRSVAQLAVILLLSQVLVVIVGRTVHKAMMLRAVQTSEAALRVSEAKFRTLAETTASAIFIHQAGRFRYVNPWAETITGYAREELLQLNYRHLVHPEHRAMAEERWQAGLKGEHVRVQGEIRILTKTGEARWVDVTAAHIDFDGQPAVLATAFDVTGRKQAEQQIQYQAYHDALTGLPNRALFIDRLGVALARARRRGECLAVMFLDLDHFKLINDTMGHDAGDRLLQEVARRLQGCVREEDTVSRVGGDEFTLLQPDCTRGEDAAKVAQQILDALGRPFLLDGQEIFVSASIGIGLYPADGGDPDSLLKNADSAMYRAKEVGRNNYQLFTAAMNTRAMARLHLEHGLRRALERGEFVLHYQPQVALDDGRVVGMEALVRWQHPSRGLIHPAEFVPLAEDSRLIVPLGEWVLEAACRQARAWADSGFPRVRMAVNLSARHFLERDLIERLDRIVRRTGIDPWCLELELTESAAMHNAEHTIAMLRRIREMAIRVSMDDFGTGHSSLNHLKRFPVDGVKIDQSFVGEMTVDPYDAAIVKAIIEMAHSLRLKVIAEGVETPEQLACLKAWRCDEMQGFLFSEPRPAESIVETLRTLEV